MTDKAVLSSIIVVLLLSLFSCKEEPFVESTELSNPEHFHAAVNNLSDIIVHDIFSPPVASRIYAYPAIAAYEVLRHNHSTYQTLAGQLHGLTAVPEPDTNQQISFSVAALHAFNQMGKELIFSEAMFEEFVDEKYAELKGYKISRKVFDNSLRYGQQVVDHIKTWSAKDNYHQSRSFPKFSITREPARWKPTPPGYMDGIEPHWNKIRTFVLDSATQFVPPPPTAYDIEKGSTFYDEVMEVYEVVNNADEEEKEIASFWDCNPYVLNVTGHVMHATKKITPGGHWVGIVGVASRTAKADLMKSVEAYVLTTIALADGFISCWDEKYRSNLTRPETVINEHYDQDWIPLLQTPPFPEYTSGHSVISRAAAVALTSIFGDDFAYDDDVEVQYGLPIRSFKSFYHASEEAAISRLYGGIHYRPAIDYGVLQGQKVGEFILSRVKLKKED